MKQIRIRMIELDLTQGKLAQKAGISQPYLSQVISGQRRPAVDVLCRLASVLGWTLDQTATALQAARDRAEVAQAA